MNGIQLGCRSEWRPGGSPARRPSAPGRPIGSPATERARRPLAVALSTFGSSFGWRECTFIVWMAPGDRRDRDLVDVRIRPKPGRYRRRSAEPDPDRIRGDRRRCVYLRAQRGSGGSRARRRAHGPGRGSTGWFEPGRTRNRARPPSPEADRVAVDRQRGARAGRRS